jgi:membrane-associated phospholipid phosphatase
MIAVLVVAGLAAFVWHATRLDQLDTWVMRWQERADAHADAVAEGISATVPLGVTLVSIVALSTVAWLAGRRDAVVLAATAAPAALVVEVLLKRLVHRTWNGDPALIFPSGHVAVATATAMSAVLVLRVVPVSPPIRHAAVWMGGAFVLVVAAARLVETVHSLTDVVAGGMTGVVVSLGLAMTITALARRLHLSTLHFH